MKCRSASTDETAFTQTCPVKNGVWMTFPAPFTPGMQITAICRTATSASCSGSRRRRCTPTSSSRCSARTGPATDPPTERPLRRALPVRFRRGPSASDLSSGGPDPADHGNAARAFLQSYRCEVRRVRLLRVLVRLAGLLGKIGIPRATFYELAKVSVWLKVCMSALRIAPVRWFP